MTHDARTSSPRREAGGSTSNAATTSPPGVRPDSRSEASTRRSSSTGWDRAGNPRQPAPDRPGPEDRVVDSTFIFATGIENSYPTINEGKKRIDEMEKCGHYKHWRRDFECVEELGIRFLRYGPPLHRTWVGDRRYVWAFADEAFAELRRRGIVPIVDLCHFGVPDWVGDFQNPDFPQLFALYAAAFAERYPWVQLYTPVNEMFVCAVFSAMYGWWNEQLKTDRGFVTALKHIVKANVMAMIEILKRRPDAIFIQSESSEYFHADSPAA